MSSLNLLQKPSTKQYLVVNSLLNTFSVGFNVHVKASLEMVLRQQMISNIEIKEPPFVTRVKMGDIVLGPEQVKNSIILCSIAQ